MRKRLEPADAITLVGGLVGLLGQGLKASDLNQGAYKGIADLLTVVGIGALLFGVVYTVRDVNKRLGALDASSLAQRVDALASRVDALTIAYRVSTTATTVARVVAWANANPKLVHFRAASGTVDHLFNTYTSPIAGLLERFTEDQTLELEVKDLSPVHDLMWRLGRDLPVGGAWFGITLLSRRSAWERPSDGAPDDSFGRFVEKMRARAKAGELDVVRIYHFETPADLDAMRDLLAEEEASRIVVRCVVGGERPPDLSLLWAEAEQNRGRAGSAGRQATDDIVAGVRAQGRSPICALRYHAHASSLLTRVVMNAGGSKEFDDAAGAFTAAWRRARPITAFGKHHNA